MGRFRNRQCRQLRAGFASNRVDFRGGQTTKTVAEAGQVLPRLCVERDPSRASWNPRGQHRAISRVDDLDSDVNPRRIRDAFTNPSQFLLRRHVDGNDLTGWAVGDAHDEPTATGVPYSYGVLTDLIAAYHLGLELDGLAFLAAHQRS